MTMNKKGKLTIFFGYAAGVGKTYAMLKEAHQKKNQGADLVVGYIEGHDRKETTDLIDGLEVIEKKKISYKDHIFYEFDLDKSLERKPEIILVDELAHTNAPSSRHEKRYQDIEELLKAGIDVYTSLNVQHLESLHDTVESITKVKVNERIPDYIFDQADDIKLVDIQVEELIERLEAGKVYKKSQIKRALEHFFKKNNLIALREIALRRCADRINLYSDQENKPFSKEHILVCISPSPTNQKVIRTASKMASSYHAEFTALFVENSDTKFLKEDEKKSLKENIKLAKHLKANIVVSYGDDIAFQISQYAKISGVSKLVLGRSNQKISILRKTTLIDSISSQSPNLDIYIIPDSKTVSKKNNFIIDKNSLDFNLKDSLVTLSIMAFTTCLSYFLFKSDFDITNIVLIHLLASCAIGYVTGSIIYNIISVLLNILIIDFLFVEPYHTLNIYSKEYSIIFLIMLVVSILISLMQNKLKKENILAVKQAHSLDILLQTSQRLQFTRTYQEIMQESCYQLYKLLNRPIIFYPVKYDRLLEPVIYDPNKNKDIEKIYKSKEEKTVAKRVFVNNENAGATTTTLSSARGLYFAIRKNNLVYAVVGIDMSNKKDFSIQDKSLFLALINEISLAFDSLKK
jgi:two-component system sensor histidine kinase KdpD